MVHDGEKGNAGRVGAKRTRTHADGLEAVRPEKANFEGVPAALRPYGQKDSFVDALRHALRHSLPQDRTHRARRRRICHQTATILKQTVQLILDQHPELPMDGDAGQASVARLLQPFDQKRTVALRRQDVRVEIVSFDARRVGQDDSPHAERRDLRPEPPHDLRTRKREHEVDTRLWRNARVEHAA